MEAGIHHGQELAFETALRILALPEERRTASLEETFQRLVVHHRQESSKAFGRALRERQFVAPKPTRFEKLTRALGGAVTGARRGWGG